ncbi:TPA: hypothetical protein QDB48_002855 [Burkholderia vietnamiensis]|nr:hypothetical protein [Burkholderia vietnamiensis]
MWAVINGTAGDEAGFAPDDAVQQRRRLSFLQSLVSSPIVGHCRDPVGAPLPNRTPIRGGRSETAPNAGRSDRDRLSSASPAPRRAVGGSKVVDACEAKMSLPTSIRGMQIAWTSLTEAPHDAPLTRESAAMCILA